MKDINLKIEDGIITETWLEDKDGNPAGGGRFFLPRNAAGIEADALFLLSPEAIEVEEGNLVFCSEGNCLIRKQDQALVMACENSVIPDDGSIRAIAELAFNHAEDFTRMNLNPLVIPDGTEDIGYRACALSTANPVHIMVPGSVSHIGSMAFMIRSEAGQVKITIHGDPVLDPGVFGTKTEAADSDNEIYKTLPEILYTKPEELIVCCAADSSVEAYCNRYGIHHELA